MRRIKAFAVVVLTVIVALPSARAARVTLLEGKLTLEVPGGFERFKMESKTESRNVSIAAFRSDEAGGLIQVVRGKYQTNAAAFRKGSKAQVAQFVAPENGGRVELRVLKNEIGLRAGRPWADFAFTHLSAQDRNLHVYSRRVATVVDGRHLEIWATAKGRNRPAARAMVDTVIHSVQIR